MEKYLKKTENGKIWRSYNGGKTWISQTKFNQNEWDKGTKEIEKQEKEFKQQFDFKEDLKQASKIKDLGKRLSFLKMRLIEYRNSKYSALAERTVYYKDVLKEINSLQKIKNEEKEKEINQFKEEIGYNSSKNLSLQEKKDIFDNLVIIEFNRLKSQFLNLVKKIPDKDFTTDEIYCVKQLLTRNEAKPKNYFGYHLDKWGLNSSDAITIHATYHEIRETKRWEKDYNYPYFSFITPNYDINTDKTAHKQKIRALVFEKYWKFLTKFQEKGYKTISTKTKFNIQNLKNIFFSDYIKKFIDIENRLITEGYFDKTGKWIKYKNDLVALIMILCNYKYFKKNNIKGRHLKETDYRNFFEKRYNTNIKYQFKPSQKTKLNLKGYYHWIGKPEK